jgi:hypothetical protein
MLFFMMIHSLLRAGREAAAVHRVRSLNGSRHRPRTRHWSHHQRRADRVRPGRCSLRIQHSRLPSFHATQLRSAWTGETSDVDYNDVDADDAHIHHDAHPHDTHPHYSNIHHGSLVGIQQCYSGYARDCRLCRSCVCSGGCSCAALTTQPRVPRHHSSGHRTAAPTGDIKSLFSSSNLHC